MANYNMLESVDQLIGILYNERMKELIEENGRLRSLNTYCIYYRYNDEDKLTCLAAVVCNSGDILEYVQKTIDKTFVRYSFIGDTAIINEHDGQKYEIVVKKINPNELQTTIYQYGIDKNGEIIIAKNDYNCMQS